MPQYARKTRQMISVTGIHPPVYAGRFYTVAGSVQTLVGKTQYISKASGGTWPGADWITSLGPGHAMVMDALSPVQVPVNQETNDERDSEVNQEQNPTRSVF